MPEKKTIERAHAAKRAGKSPSTQAGAFVKEQIDHVRRQARSEVREAGGRDRIVRGTQVGCGPEGAEEGVGVRRYPQESGEGHAGRPAQNSTQREHGIEGEAFCDIHAGAQTRGQRGRFAYSAFEANT
jgi:hypothetical protein